MRDAVAAGAAAAAGADAGGESPASLHETTNDAATIAPTSQRFEAMVVPLSASLESSKSGGRSGHLREQLEQLVQPLQAGRRRTKPVGLAAQPAASLGGGSFRGDGRRGLPSARLERLHGDTVEQAQRV